MLPSVYIVDKEDKLSWTCAYHTTATSICIILFLFRQERQQRGTVKMPTVSWAGQKPSGLGSVSEEPWDVGCSPLFSDELFFLEKGGPPYSTSSEEKKMIYFSTAVLSVF